MPFCDMFKVTNFKVRSTASDISADRGNARNQKGNESLLRYHNKAKEKQDIMKLVNQQLIKNTN